MSLTSGQKASWQDLLSLYATLRTVRSQWGFSQPSDPTRGVGSTIEDTDVSSLNNLVNEMRSNSYLSSVANTGITVPSAGSIIKASFLTTINNTMTNIKNTNGANFSFGTNTTNFGFSTNGTNFSFFSNGNFTFGTNTGNFNFGTNTANNGFGTNTSNNGFGTNTSNNGFGTNTSNNGFGSNTSNNGFNANSTNVGSFVWRGSSFSSNYSNNTHRAA